MVDEASLTLLQKATNPALGSSTADENRLTEIVTAWAQGSSSWATTDSEFKSFSEFWEASFGPDFSNYCASLGGITERAEGTSGLMAFLELSRPIVYRSHPRVWCRYNGRGDYLFTKNTQTGGPPPITATQWKRTPPQQAAPSVHSVRPRDCVWTSIRTGVASIDRSGFARGSGAPPTYTPPTTPKFASMDGRQLLDAARIVAGQKLPTEPTGPTAQPDAQWEAIATEQNRRILASAMELIGKGTNSCEIYFWQTPPAGDIAERGLYWLSEIPKGEGLEKIFRQNSTCTRGEIKIYPGGSSRIAISIYTREHPTDSDNLLHGYPERISTRKIIRPRETQKERKESEIKKGPPSPTRPPVSPVLPGSEKTFHSTGRRI
ncbi:hypothetical protein [Kitasatospora sp. NBC_00070]|uniref:hypothetical protein n=1 Tax=Kitasatospora sp. NBC_00070 TaxID=2975962 RepID=UPI00386025BD